MFVSHENGKSGQKFISCIANAVKKRVAAILGSSDFLSLLTEYRDGMQAMIKRWCLFALNEIVSFLFIYIYRKYRRSSYMIIQGGTIFLLTKIGIVVPPPQVTKLLL